MRYADLNSDLGESFGAYTIGMDREVIPLVTSVNVACGMHAGDPSVMERTVAMAVRCGTAIGAHPGYPDLQGFGRRRLAMKTQEIVDCTVYQIGALQAFLRLHGTELQHVKLHGALYNDAAVNYELSLAVCRAVRSIAPEAIMLCLSGSEMLRAAGDAGLRTAGEVFADRAYNEDGTLVSRTLPGAVLKDPDEMIARTVRMVREGKVRTVTGRDIAIRADSVCVHGDNPAALDFVRRIREKLTENGIGIADLRTVTGNAD